MQTFCQRTLREVKMLTRFEHENIIDLKDVICENTVDKLKVRIMSATSIPIWGYKLYDLELVHHVGYIRFVIVRVVYYMTFHDIPSLPKKILQHVFSTFNILTHSNLQRHRT